VTPSASSSGPPPSSPWVFFSAHDGFAAQTNQLRLYKCDRKDLDDLHLGPLAVTPLAREAQLSTGETKGSGTARDR